MKTQHEWTKEQIGLLEQAPDVPDVLTHGMQQAKNEGLWLEFGVARGMSLAKIATHVGYLPPERRPHVAGFDSFKGLPEDWVWNHSQMVPKGFFAQDVIPVIPGAEIVVGLFQKSLEHWLAKRLKSNGGERITLIHVDSDLYSAARFVLKACAPMLADDAVIVFDEIVGYHGFDNHEWRALFESVEGDGLFRFEWLARKAGAQQAAIRVHVATLEQPKEGAPA